MEHIFAVGELTQPPKVVDAARATGVGRGNPRPTRVPVTTNTNRPSAFSEPEGACIGISGRVSPSV